MAGSGREVWAVGRSLGDMPGRDQWAKSDQEVQGELALSFGDSKAAPTHGNREVWAESLGRCSEKFPQIQRNYPDQLSPGPVGLQAPEMLLYLN